MKGDEGERDDQCLCAVGKTLSVIVHYSYGASQ